jgi:hypothetical protein
MRRVVIDLDSRKVESSQSSQRRRKTSPSDLRRKQERLSERARQVEAGLTARRVERSDAWADGGRSDFLAYQQDDGLDGLGVLGQQRRVLRAEVRAEAGGLSPAPDLAVAADVLAIPAVPVEGAEYRGAVSMRGTRS